MKKNTILSMLTAASVLGFGLSSNLHAQVSWTADLESAAIDSSGTENNLFKVKSMSEDVPATLTIKESSGDFAKGKVLELKRAGDVTGNPNVQIIKVDPSLSINPDQVAILSFDAKRTGKASNLAVDFVNDKNSRVGKEPLLWVAAQNDKFARVTAVANRSKATVALPGGLAPAEPNQTVLYLNRGAEFSEIQRKPFSDGSVEKIQGFLFTTPLNSETTWTFDNFVFTDNAGTLTPVK